jgi:hypothetical protein
MTSVQQTLWISVCITPWISLYNQCVDMAIKTIPETAPVRLRCKDLVGNRTQRGYHTECIRLPRQVDRRVQCIFTQQRKRGHKERELDLPGVEGNLFRLILRQNNFNPLDFSIVLALKPSDTNLLFRLRHYNGKSHEHTNHIENNTFYDIHVHLATERDQDLGGREDAYAEPTDRFSDFQTSIRCFIADCGFEEPYCPQLSLFPEG